MHVAISRSLSRYTLFPRSLGGRRGTTLFRTQNPLLIFYLLIHVSRSAVTKDTTRCIHSVAHKSTIICSPIVRVSTADYTTTVYIPRTTRSRGTLTNAGRRKANSISATGRRQCNKQRSLPAGFISRKSGACRHRDAVTGDFTRANKPTRRRPWSATNPTTSDRDHVSSVNVDDFTTALLY